MIWESSFPLSFRPPNVCNKLDSDPLTPVERPRKRHVRVYTQERQKSSAGYSTSKRTVFKFSIPKDYALLSQVTVLSTSVK